jgi:hypothetical protein
MTLLRNLRFLICLILSAVLFFIGAGLLALGFMSGAKPAKLTWEPPVVRKSIMSFGYKVYANPQIDGGKYFLSKLVLKNSGGKPIHDITVSYHVPDYIPWTTPETSGDLPPGNSTVELFYPKFSEQITHLKNQTTATLETKLQWREEGGTQKEEILRTDFLIYGVNEVQYSDLPADDMLTWYDQWNLAQFVVCMVTPNDPIVKEYAAAITKRTGGTLAGVSQDPRELLELMKATYNYMRETGMRYASSEGVPTTIGDTRTIVQTVRLPRDVITTNNGLCIELAILWASILDHLGCQTYLLLRPGHAFTIVQAGDQSIPIECTAITPKAVGESGDVPFEKAVQMASEDLQKQQYKILFPVQQYQSQGFSSPELPDVDIDKIEKMLASRERQTANPGPDRQQPPETREAQAEESNPPPTQQGMARYEHRAGLVSFSYPGSWQIGQAPQQLGITWRAYDPSSLVGMDVIEVPNAVSANAAIRAVSQAFARAGARIEVEDSKKQGDLTVMLGRTRASSGNTEWFAVLRPVRGGVIGVAAGCPSSSFQSNRQTLLQLLDTVRFP